MLERSAYTVKVNSVCRWYKDRQNDAWNRIEASETDMLLIFFFST